MAKSRTTLLLLCDKCFKNNDTNFVNDTNFAQDEYTFQNEKLGRFTMIDYLCISDCLLNCVNDYRVVKSAINISDHQPVAFHIALPNETTLLKMLQLGCASIANDTASDNNDLQTCLRWDKGDCQNYYYLTGQAIYTIYNSLFSWTHVDCASVNDFVEMIYGNLVTALLQASNVCIPRVSDHSCKHWWSSDLTKLKKQAIQSFNIWSDAGKPRTGILFDAKNRDKRLYKLEINNAKR